MTDLKRAFQTALGRVANTHCAEFIMGEFADAEEVAISASPRFEKVGKDTRELPADFVFAKGIIKRAKKAIALGTIATAALPDEGTAQFSQVVKFHRSCTLAATAASASALLDKDDQGADAYPATLLNAEANEFYQMNPVYRQDRLDELDAQAQTTHQPRELPSDRLRGKLERQNRKYGIWKLDSPSSRMQGTRSRWTSATS